MKKPTANRGLTDNEIGIARKVFKDRIPYRKIWVTNGLGSGDRPFAVPNSFALGPFAIKGRGGGGIKYILHVGEGVYGMHRTIVDRKLLIHELTHVWQGEHDSSYKWSVAVWSLKDQAFSGDAAYDYDEKRLKPWSWYGPEQQAHIVEDWYANGRKEFDPRKQTGDRRFYYIKKHIWGERARGDWLTPPVRELAEGEFKGKIAYPDYHAINLLPILKRRLRENDTAGIAARKTEIEQYFRRLDRDSSAELLARLQARRPDKLAQAFEYHFHTATRKRLLGILKEKS